MLAFALGDLDGDKDGLAGELVMTNSVFGELSVVIIFRMQR